MNIRHADSGDAEEINEVALKSWKDAYRGVLSEDTVEEVIDDWYSVEDLEKQSDDPVFYVAEIEDDVVGFVHARVEDGKARLHRIYIDPDHQRKGIGSRLYSRILEKLPDDTERIELEVIAENEKGVSFYKKKGFKEEKTEEVELKGEKIVQKVLSKEL